MSRRPYIRARESTNFCAGLVNTERAGLVMGSLTMSHNRLRLRFDGSHIAEIHDHISAKYDVDVEESSMTTNDNWSTESQWYNEVSNQSMMAKFIQRNQSSTTSAITCKKQDLALIPSCNQSHKDLTLFGKMPTSTGGKFFFSYWDNDGSL